MAARKTSRSDEDEALDPIEAADVQDDEDEDDAFDDELDGDEDLEADDLEPDLDEEDTELEEGDESLDAVADLDPEDEDLPEAGPVVEAVFDDDEIVAAVTGDDDEDEVDGLREGEFVCRSCFMAKRETQLADPERMLCRDCA